MPMQRLPDPYAVLGVARGATDAQIKAAHRALAKRYHPDAATGDALLFLRVQEAYQLLSDPLRRREWDARHAPGPVRADAPTRPGRAAGVRPHPAP
ncbi:MAG: J domain-containing protein, partial [Chloroflexota bacterium]|nr:J domain-containing protein [Chloroflexota bacterium]